MGRPRKYPNHSETKARLNGEGGTAYLPTGVTFANPATDAFKAGLLSEARGIIRPVPAGYNDSLSIMLTVDMLLRLEADSTIRPKHVAELLTQEYPQLLWRPIVVGRILSDLAEAASVLDTETPPIVKALLDGGHRYVLNPTYANWTWLMKVRVALGKLARHDIAVIRATGEAVSHGSFPFDCLAGVAYERDAVAA